MSVMSNYFIDHLEQGADVNPAAASVHAIENTASHYRIFKMGRLRFALPAPEVCAIVPLDEHDCELFDPVLVVPAGYAKLARSDPNHSACLQLADSRLALGPCEIEADLSFAKDQIKSRQHTEESPWIIATVEKPPCLVLDRQRLIEHLSLLSHSELNLA